MAQISKQKQDAIDLLSKLDIAINEQNLVYYSEKGDFDNVNLLIDAGISANAYFGLKQDDGDHYYSPLYSAYTNGHLKVAELLIKNGADINFFTEDSKMPTPINYAIEKNDIDLLEFFIKQGADVNINKGDFENIPIFNAIKHKHYDILKILIENNVKIDLCKDGFSPLTYSINNNDVEATKILLNSKIDINKACNKKEETPLIIAIRKKNFEIFKLLIEKGADINKARNDGKTPMFIAYQNRQEEIIKVLISLKAKPLNEDELESATKFNIDNKLNDVGNFLTKIKKYNNSKTYYIIVALLLLLAILRHSVMVLIGIPILALLIGGAIHFPLNYFLKNNSFLNSFKIALVFVSILIIFESSNSSFDLENKDSIVNYLEGTWTVQEKDGAYYYNRKITFDKNTYIGWTKMTKREIDVDDIDWGEPKCKGVFSLGEINTFINTSAEYRRIHFNDCSFTFSGAFVSEHNGLYWDIWGPFDKE